jgi:hypothetical protein
MVLNILKLARNPHRGLTAAACIGKNHGLQLKATDPCDMGNYDGVA